VSGVKKQETSEEWEVTSLWGEAGPQQREENKLRVNCGIASIQC
jgi:hypothetical protein